MEKTVGPGGVECHLFKHESGSQVLISSIGGHILSWKTSDGVERLYLSEDAEFKPGTAIRGGVPVIFPQFNANGPLGRHGFARKSVWCPDYERQRIVLSASDSTRAEWPHEFEISIQVQLSESELTTLFTVTNTDKVPFSFQAALHTYFLLGNVEETLVCGLGGAEFHEEIEGLESTSGHEEECVAFGSEVDRSYPGGAKRSVEICENNQPTFRIESIEFPDLVVWNPGPDHSIGDLPREGWRKFVCVESAQLRDGPLLHPGETWTGQQKVTAC